MSNSSQPLLCMDGFKPVYFFDPGECIRKRAEVVRSRRIEPPVNKSSPVGEAGLRRRVLHCR